MSLFDIDFNQQAVELMQPDKREPENKALWKTVLKPLQWARDMIFGIFKEGNTVPPYSPGSYNTYDQVKYNKAIYESLIDSNTDLPTTSNWFLVVENFIGTDERQKYNGQKLVLEYALNKEFDGVFRQPVTAINSDIYLTKLAPVLAGFRIGETEAGSSNVGADTSSDSIGGTYPFVQLNNFQINIPTALFSATNDAAIRNFVDKYIPISLNYLIVQY